MRLLTTEQAAQETGASYRALLRWADEGWIKPHIRAGSDARRLYFFNDDSLWAIREFDQLRHHFDPSEWPKLATAIQASAAHRSPGEDFIAVTRKAGKKKTPEIEYRPVKRGEFEQLVICGALVMLIALGLAGEAQPVCTHETHAAPAPA